jgi:CubicO group peptidase (beta-lactamase class C family)
MERAVESSVFPGGVLLVSKKKDILIHQAFGVADLGTMEKVLPSTLFDLASLTKPLATTMALIDLAQANRLGLDQPLKDFFPDSVGSDKASITVEDLMRHSSGLCAHRPFYKAIFNLPELKRRGALRELILAEPLVYPPGTRELYSDLGFILLAWIVEHVANERLDHYLRKNIYLPLKIQGLNFKPKTSLPVSGVAATEHCPWRGRVLRGEVHDENAWVAGGVEGHAGLFGTALDVWILLVEIMDALQGNPTGVIEHEYIRFLAVKKPGRTHVAGFDTPSLKKSSAGHFFSPFSLGHLGFTGTSFWLDPSQHAIVILLTNRVHPTRENEKIRQFRPFIHDLAMETFFNQA